MKRLYFMRHGLSEMNKLGFFSGRTDSPLTEEGRVQCQDAALGLSKVKIDAIVSSPMKRAIDSAKIVAQGIGFPESEILINELFMERNFGSMEGERYQTGLNLDGHSDVEHSNSVIERAQMGLEFLRKLKADNILLVSHGAVGRALVCAINSDIDFQSVGGFNNAEVVRLF